jgi:hypothetical protein
MESNPWTNKRCRICFHLNTSCFACFVEAVSFLCWMMRIPISPELDFLFTFPDSRSQKNYRITCCNWESTHEFPANSLRHFMWHLRWTEGLFDPFPMNNPRPSDNLSSKIGCKPGQIMVSWYHGPVRIKWTCNSNIYLEWSSHGWKIHRWVYNEAMIYIMDDIYIYTTEIYRTYI